MKVSVTFDFDDPARLALNLHMGSKGKATREQLADWMTINADLETVLFEYEAQFGWGEEGTP